MHTKRGKQVERKTETADVTGRINGRKNKIHRG